MKKAFGLLFLLWASLSFAGSTFLRQYEHAGEVITKVNTVKITDYGTIILSLEGYYTQTNAPFSRVQSFNLDGDLLNDYTDAYVGEPSILGSGLFILNHFTNGDSLSNKELLTPVLTPVPVNRFRFDWRIGYPDSTGSVDYTQNLLPDSLDTIVEFPTAINRYMDVVFNGEYIFIVSGRAIVNGVYRCFALNIDNMEREFEPIIYFPSLQHISGLTRLYSLTDEYDGYLAIGQANGWTGKIILVDRESNIKWQQDFTDGCDASQIPIFTTPLLSVQDYSGHQKTAISFQNRDRVVHVALYIDQTLQTIYSEQLDAYIEAIPLFINNYSVTFAYLKNGVQIIRQIDFEGNTIWSRELPGIGSFGKNSLTMSFYWTPFCDYLVSGRMPGGGYYLAKVDPMNGRISYDTISQPETMKMSIYPNPSEDIVNIGFDLKQSGKVKLELYNLKGQKVMNLQNTFFPKGKFLFSYALSPVGYDDMPAGVYFLRLEQNGKHLTQKLIFLHRRYGVPVIKSATN